MANNKRQTALVTGASGGIGLDLARLFARDGYDLVLVARSEERLRQIAAELEGEFKITATVIVADLAGQGGPSEVLRGVKERDLTIDVLVNNAGFGLNGAFAETDLEAELEMIQLNVAALTHLTKLFLRDMVARKSGKILNLASTAAFQPGPFMAVYYATKAYVLSFSEAIAEELQGTGVTVTALCPGPTRTGFAEKADMQASPLFTTMKPMKSADVASAGYEAMKKGRRVAITGMLNKIAAQSVRITPRNLVVKIARRLQENR